MRDPCSSRWVFIRVKENLTTFPRTSGHIAEESIVFWYVFEFFFVDLVRPTRRLYTIT